MIKLKFGFIALSLKVCLFFALTVTCFSYNKISDSISDVSSKVDSLDAKKWGSVYVSFPHLSLGNIFSHDRCWAFFLSFVFEYKKYVSKKIALGVKFNINNIECLFIIAENGLASCLSIVPCLYWVYSKKGNNVYSGSFSPIAFHFFVKEGKDKLSMKEYLPFIFNFGFTLLKYENIKNGLYINVFNYHLPYYSFYRCRNLEKFCSTLIAQTLSIEFGFNICRVIGKKKTKVSV